MVTLLIQRYGQRYSRLDRGGIWANIIMSTIPKYKIYEELHRKMGKYNYGIVTLYNPFFVNVISPDGTAYGEHEYPLKLYALLTGSIEADADETVRRLGFDIRKECSYMSEVLDKIHYPDCVEEKLAQLEKESAYLLRRKGYDGAIFTYVNPRKETNIMYRQVFYIGGEININWFD